MLPLALSAFEKAAKVPSSFWLKVFLFFVAVFALVFIVRKLAQVNKFVAFAVIFVACAVLGFTWIYERNEPEFLTPVIDRIAPFFPSKGEYNKSQAADVLGEKPTPKPKH